MTTENVKVRTSHNHIAGTVHAYLHHHTPERVDPADNFNVIGSLKKFLPEHANLFHEDTHISLVTVSNTLVTPAQYSEDATPHVLTPTQSSIAGIVTRNPGKEGYILLHGVEHLNWLNREGYILGTYIYVNETPIA